MMEVSFQHTVDECFEVTAIVQQRFSQECVTRFRILIAGLCVALLVGVLGCFIELYKVIADDSKFWFHYGLILFVTSIANIYFYIKYFQKERRKFLTLNKTIWRTNYHYTIQDKVLQVSYGFGYQSTYPLTSLLKVIDRSDFLLIYIDIMQCLYIPSRAFKDNTHRAEFIKALNCENVIKSNAPYSTLN